MMDNQAKLRHRPIIRVFVSSTFTDLKHERDALQRDVFPKLEHFCAIRQFQFQAIDLRWGVSTEASLDHRTMRICFEELRRSQVVSPQPNFLILLGDRYGWRPLPEEISEDEFGELHKHAASDTHREVLAAWYRCDSNVIPSVHVLRARTDSPDGQDYTWLKDAEGNPLTDAKGNTQDTPAWVTVQEMLWEVVNRAFPISDLPNRFASLASGEVPSIVRFQASATEQEIWLGVRQPDARQHIFAVDRHIANFDKFAGDSLVKDFVERGPRDALEQLKEHLECFLGRDNIIPATRVELTERKDAIGNRILEVTPHHLEGLCKVVLGKLKAVIRRQIDEYWGGTAMGADREGKIGLQREDEDHDRFANERAPSGVFIGRVKEKGRILAYLSGSNQRPFVVTGVSGSGKSSLLAAVAREANASSALVLMRFLGTTRSSSDLPSLLGNLCQSLREKFPLDVGFPRDVRELEEEFYGQLAKATADRPIFVILDALDNLDTAGQALSLWWLRSVVPKHAKIVVSCLSEDVSGLTGMHVVALKERGLLNDSNYVSLEELAPNEAQELWRCWLKRARRRLSTSQQHAVDTRILSTDACGRRHPLYLKILFDESCQWKSFEPPPANLGSCTTDLIDSLLERLSDPKVHGLVVKRALGYLASARYGLSEPELLEVLFRDEDYKNSLKGTSHALPENARRIPIAIWSRLRFDLGPYFVERGVPGGEALVASHGEFARQIRARFLPDDVTWRTFHQRLADYYAFTPAPDDQPHAATLGARQVVELPFQQTRAGRTQDLLATLTSFDFIDAKCRHGFAFDLQEDYRRALAEFEPLGAEANAKSAALVPAWLSESVSVVLSAETDAHPLEGCGPILAQLAQKGAGAVVTYCVEPSEQQDVPNSLPESSAIAAVSSYASDARPLARLQAFEKFVASHLHTVQKSDTNSAILARNTDAGLEVAESAEMFLKRRNLPWIEHLRCAEGNQARYSRVKTIQSPFTFRNMAVSSDGRIAAALSPQALAAWNLDSGEMLFAVEFGGSALRLSATGDRIVVANGSVLELRDGKSGTLLRRVESDSKIRHLAISADGMMAVIGVCVASETTPSKKFDWRASLPKEWNKPGNETLLELFAEFYNGLHGDDNEEARAWYSEVAVIDLMSGRGYNLDGSVATDGALWLSPCGRMLAVIDRNHDITVWNVSQGVRLATIKGALACDQIEVSDDGKMLGWFSQEGKVRTWDLSGGVPLRTFAEGISIIGGGTKTHSYLSFALGRDGLSLATLRGDGAFGLCEIFSAPFQCNGMMLTDHATHVQIAGDRFITAWHADAVMRSADLVLGGDDFAANEICIWEPLSESTVKVTRYLQEFPLNGVAIAADGTRAACVTGYFARVWEIGSPKPIVQEILWMKTKTAALNPTGQFAVTSRLEESIAHPENNGPLLLVWSVPDQYQLVQVRTKISTPTSVAISNDSRFAMGLSGMYGESQEILLIDFMRCKRSRVFDTHSQHTHLAVSPDGRTIATAGSDAKTVKLFDCRTGPIGSMPTDDLWLQSLFFSGDGRMLLGATENRIVIWSLHTQGRPRAIQPPCHKKFIHALGLTGDCKLIATADDEGIVCLTELETGNTIVHWRLDTGVNCSSAFSAGNIMAVGLTSGEFCYLRLINYRESRPYATVRRDWHEMFSLLYDSSEPPQQDSGFVYCCPHCRARNVPPSEIIQRIRHLTKQAAIGKSQILAVAGYSETAWGDSALTTSCPACQGQIRFNPFFSDAFEGVDATEIQRHIRAQM